MLSLTGPARAAFAVAFGLSVTRVVVASDTDTPAPAPDSATPDSQPVESVTVTARRLNEARASIQTQTGASTYTIDSKAIQAMPGADNTLLNQVILQAPSVAQDSFGQLHVRGEHNGLQYRLNGIILPEGISVFGQSLDPRLIQSMQLMTGALPAEYGLRTAGIVDLTTKSGLIDPYGELSIYGGSHGQVQPSFFDGGSSGNLSYFVTGDFLRNDLGIESPDGSSSPLHDHTKQYHGFGYFEYILTPDDRLSVVLGTSHGEFQIPNRYGLTPQLGYTVDGQSEYPSNDLDENQTEITHYGILSLQHSHGSLDVQSSFSWRYSSLTYFPDPIGDLLYNGISQDAYKRDVSLGWQTDAALTLGSAHTLRAGLYLQHDRATSNTTSQVLPVDADGMQTGGPVSLVDNSMRSQNIESLYLQDEWRLISSLTLNYGVRFDHLSAYTTGHQVSPRVNLVWKPLDGMTVHGGYSRYFSPPPFELVGLASIDKLAGTSAAPAVTLADPPLPEVANYYDVGIQQGLGAFTVGVDTYYKQSSNLIDEGQFGAPIILTPFNYRYGLQYGAELTLSYNKDGFSAYTNLAAQRARGKDIISSQFNFDSSELAYIQNHFIPLDHEQHITASAGASYLWAGTRFSADMLLGSGLRANLMLSDGENIPNGTRLPYYEQFNVGISHTFPHWGGDASRAGPTVRLDVVNLFDSEYQIRDGTGVGVGAPQYGPRRGVFVGVSAPL